MTHNTGLIRITLGFLCALGAVGGMDQQPGAPLLAQSLIALAGLGLMLWAAVDINRLTTQTLNRLED